MSGPPWMRSVEDGEGAELDVEVPLVEGLPVLDHLRFRSWMPFINQLVRDRNAAKSKSWPLL